MAVFALTGRVPGALRLTADLTEAEPEVTEAVFFDAADCLSRIAEDVLVMLLLPEAGLEVTVLPEVLVLFIGRLLTDEPPLREVLPANTLSDPVLWRVPLYTKGL